MTWPTGCDKADRLARENAGLLGGLGLGYQAAGQILLVRGD